MNTLDQVQEKHRFMQMAHESILHHLDDSDFKLNDFVKDMLVSSSTLYNKIHETTGLSVSGYISAVRMDQAVKIARLYPELSQTKISMMVGFNSPKYFSKCFKKRYSMLFKDYLKKVNVDNPYL